MSSYKYDQDSWEFVSCHDDSSSRLIQLDPTVTQELRFENTGAACITDFIPVDTVRKHFVSFEAKSVGKVPSIGHFYIDCYDKNKQRITRPDIKVISDIPPVTITGASEDRKTLFIEEDHTDWKLESRDVSRNCLALYLNGETTILSFYSLEAKNSNSIELSKPLPMDIGIVANVTKARLHYDSCNSFIYPAMINEKIPSGTWTTYKEHGITGESFGAENAKIFRPETKFVRLGFLANYGQMGEGAVMLVKNFEFGLSIVSF